MKSVKAKNEMRLGDGAAREEPERFGRWILKQASNNMFDNRSRSVLATIEEQQKPVPARQSIDQSSLRRGRSSLATINSKQVTRKAIDEISPDERMHTIGGDRAASNNQRHAK